MTVNNKKFTTPKQHKILWLTAEKRVKQSIPVLNITVVVQQNMRQCNRKEHISHVQKTIRQSTNVYNMDSSNKS